MMKLRMTALALVASAVAAAPAAAQDLVAHYPFDETSGTVVNDRSGNGTPRGDRQQQRRRRSGTTDAA